MQSVKLVAAAALVLAGVTISTAVGAGAIESRPGIAFASNRSGDSEIYLMKPDGTGVRRLTHTPKFDAPVQWSPDGRKLLFYSQRSSGGDAWVMNADGTAQRNLTRNPAHDSPGGWSPDAKQIVFDSNRDGPGGIYVMNADGSGVRRLTEGDDHNPVWSPDGKTIVFVSERSGGKPELDAMNDDGSDRHTLTAGPNVGFPQWSPDGRKIAFVSGPRHKVAIYVMNPDGTGVRKVTRASEEYFGGPSWSPDGRRLAFSGGQDDPAGEIYVMNADGSRLQRLTHDRFGENGPVWG